MLVKNNSSHIVQFGLRYGSVEFLPGITDVSEEFIKELQEHPLFKHRVEEGDFEIMQAEQESDGRQSVRSLLKMIPDITDVEYLQDLLEKEDRETVKKAIRKQLSRLEVSDD